MHNALHHWPLYRVAQALRDGSLDSTRYVEHLLQRSQTLGSELNSWAWQDANALRHAARQADSTRDEQAPLLHGIPISIKDTIDTQDAPTSYGSPLYQAHLPNTSAVCVQNLRRQGALLLGKDTTTEFAWHHPTATRNPLDVLHTAGGSSSGSGANVAAGLSPGSVATQTIGSIIRPAAYCGVIGFKPTQGHISLEGVHPVSPSFDHVGVITRTLPDAWLLYRALVDDTPAAVPDWTPSSTQSLARGWRIRAVRSPLWERTEAHQQDAFHTAIATLRSQGLTIHEDTLPESFQDAWALLNRVLSAEAARIHANKVTSTPDQTSPALHKLVRTGLAISDADYVQDLQSVEALRRQFHQWLGDTDLLLTPSTTGEAPRRHDTTGDGVMAGIWTLTGAPAVTVPWGQGPHGLPLGLQLVGRHGADAALLTGADGIRQLLRTGRHTH